MCKPLRISHYCHIQRTEVLCNHELKEEEETQHDLN